MLKQKIVEEWNAISSDICKKLVSKMERRIKLLINSGGGS